MYVTDFYVDTADITAALEEPDSFAQTDNPELFKTWSLGPCISSRDDDSCIHAANVMVLMERLKGHTGWKIIRCSHWGFGWTEHLSFKLLEDGKPTMVAAIVLEWVHQVQEYCVLDEEDMSRRAHEGLVENIASVARNVKVSAPEDWAEKVAEWLFRNHPAECDVQNDGSAAYPSRDCVQEALRALNMEDDE